MTRIIEKQKINEMSSILIKIKILNEQHYGSYSFKFLGWWCDLCGHTLPNRSHPSATVEATRIEALIHSYSLVLAHYKYVHKPEMTMVALAAMG